MPLQFGSYVFGEGWSVPNVDLSAELPQAKLARAHGAVIGTRRLKAEQVSIRGSFMLGGPGSIATPITSVADEVDQLAGAVALGDGPTLAISRGAGKLWLRSDRYYRNAACINFIASSKEGSENRYRAMQVDFMIPDPFQYSGTNYAPQTYSDTSWNAGLTNGATHVVNYSDGSVAQGKAFTLPVITFTFAASAAINLTLTNQATGDFLTLDGTPSPAATVINVDCLQSLVTDGAGNDQSALFGDDFPTLEPQLGGLTNTWLLNILAGNAATLSSIGFTWPKRWF